MYYEDIPSRPSVFGETWGDPLPLRVAKCDINDPHRGEIESEWYPSISHISAETLDTNAIVMGKQTQSTDRSQQNRLPIPTKRTLQDNLVLPTLEYNSCDEKDAEVPQWRYLTPTYYGEQSIS
jgi:hypothetical protein